MIVVPCYLGGGASSNGDDMRVYVSTLFSASLRLFVFHIFVGVINLFRLGFSF